MSMRLFYSITATVTNLMSTTTMRSSKVKHTSKSSQLTQEYQVPILTLYRSKHLTLSTISWVLTRRNKLNGSIFNITRVTPLVAATTITLWILSSYQVKTLWTTNVLSIICSTLWVTSEVSLTVWNGLALLYCSHLFPMTQSLWFQRDYLKCLEKLSKLT